MSRLLTTCRVSGIGLRWCDRSQRAAHGFGRRVERGLRRNAVRRQSGSVGHALAAAISARWGQPPDQARCLTTTQPRPTSSARCCARRSATICRRIYPKDLAGRRHGNGRLLEPHRAGRRRDRRLLSEHPRARAHRSGCPARGRLEDGTQVLAELDARRDAALASCARIRLLWWLRGDIYRASGVFGQGISIHPQEGIVIALNSARPNASTPEDSARQEAYSQL